MEGKKSLSCWTGKVLSGWRFGLLIGSILYEYVVLLRLASPLEIVTSFAWRKKNVLGKVRTRPQSVWNQPASWPGRRDSIWVYS